MINDPICRFDCDIPVDGVAAFVFTSAERARDLPHRPVYVAGYATGAPVRRRLPLHWPLDDIMEVGTETAAASGSAPASDRRRSTSPRSTTGSRRSCTSGWSPSGCVRSARPTECARTGGIDSDRTRRAAGALRWRRPRQRPDARRPADARVLPAAVRAGGRAAAGQDAFDRRRLPLVSPLSAARSSTARSRFDPPTPTERGGASDLRRRHG